MSRYSLLRRLIDEFSYANDLRTENSWQSYFSARWRRIRRDTRPIHLVVNGHAFHLRPDGPDLSVVRGARTEYTALSRLYPRSKSGVIIDAGGFIGSSALELSLLFPAARVISIEANHENFLLLKQNTAGRPNIEVIHAALADDNAPATLQLRNPQLGSWGFSIATSQGENMETVRTLRISELMAMVGEADLLIFKMDIEGAEVSLLNNATEWLQRTHVLMIELHERMVPGCRAAFDAANGRRCVIRSEGEKFISIGAEYFNAKTRSPT